MRRLNNFPFGPYFCLQRIGPVAYKLQLPENSKIHPVFHCSMMKPFHGPPAQLPTLESLADSDEDSSVVRPLAILDYRRASQNAPWQVLVQWRGLSPDDASWEDWLTLCNKYHLEDKVVFQGVKDVTNTGSKNMSTEAEHESNIAKQEVQTEVRPKRKIVKPSHLNDYV